MSGVVQNPSLESRRRVTRRALAVLAWILAALPCTASFAQDFEVRTANLRLAGDFWALTARIDYHLTEKALDALNNGVPLTFTVDISISRERRWWLDPEVVRVKRDRQLSYEPLTKRYLVNYPESGEQSSHGTLFGALNALGRVQSLAIVEASRLTKGETYDVALRAVLDQQTLPGPLRVLAFWGGGFSLESDWYEWTLEP